MKRKIVINPAFEALRGFVEELPQAFEQGGRLMQDERNTIKAFLVAGREVVVKRYRIPIGINRVAYTFLRRGKAERAYRYAFEVRRRGFDTPEGVAYIEERRGGLLAYSFFVSLCCPFTTEVRVHRNSLVAGNEAFFSAFVRFTVALHEAKICHLDYSPGNILFCPEGETFRFALIDINRMRFGAVSMRQGCRSMALLFDQVEAYRFVGLHYAALRRFEPSACLSRIEACKQRYARKLRFKRWWKKCLGFIS